MIQIMSETIICGIISGLVTGIVLSIILWCWNRWIRYVNTEVFTIVLDISQLEDTHGLKFGALYAYDDKEGPINRVYWFKTNRKGEFSVSIRHLRNIGFQYKCFVDFEPSQRTDVLMEIVLKAGYEKPRIGSGKSNRIWFILQGKPVAKDVNGHENNRYNPE